MLIERFEQSAVVNTAYRQTTGSLRKILGADTPLRTIALTHADPWRKTNADSGVAIATVEKRVHVSRYAGLR